MNFSDFEAAILARAQHSAACAGGKLPVCHADHDKTRKILAACAVVIAERGPHWCRSNPHQFRLAVLSQLGLVIKVLLTIASIFTGGGVWLTLLGWLLPAVLDWLTLAPNVRGAAAQDITALGHEAAFILKGATP